MLEIRGKGKKECECVGKEGRENAIEQRDRGKECLEERGEDTSSV